MGRQRRWRLRPRSWRWQISLLAQRQSAKRWSTPSTRELLVSRLKMWMGSVHGYHVSKFMCQRLCSVGDLLSVLRACDSACLAPELAALVAEVGFPAELKLSGSPDYQLKQKTRGPQHEHTACKSRQETRTKAP